MRRKIKARMRRYFGYEGLSSELATLRSQVDELQARSASEVATLQSQVDDLQARGDPVSVDPLGAHQSASIRALANGVAALYGFDVEGDVAEFGTMSGATATGLARAIKIC